MRQLSMFGESEVIPGAVMVGPDLLVQDELPQAEPTDAAVVSEESKRTYSPTFDS